MLVKPQPPGFCPTCRYVMKGPIDKSTLKRPMCCTWGPPLPVPTQVQIGIDPQTKQPVYGTAMATARAFLNDADYCWQYQAGPGVVADTPAAND